METTKDNSFLNKEIEHEGLKFIPIIELAKLEGLKPVEDDVYENEFIIQVSLYADNENRKPFVPCKFIFDKREGVFKLTETGWHNLQVKKQREMRQLCKDWGIEL